MKNSLRLNPPFALLTLLATVLYGCVTSSSTRQADASTVVDKQTEWTLVWGDEFNGAAGAAVSNTFWTHDTGDGCSAGICGWGNNEKQFYTNAPANVALNGQGQLAITATVAPSGLSCYYGPCRYTSAKIKTQGKVEQHYGRVEARIKLPQGQGLWPAFWMLGNNCQTDPWPKCGEIDIMEYRGSKATATSSAMHGPGYSGNTPIVHTFNLTNSTFADDFHIFAVEWEPEVVRFYVDDNLHYSVTKPAIQSHGPWVFDHPFFVILNMAAGGKFDGDPASDSIFPATMLVDYVHIHARPSVRLPIVTNAYQGR